MNYDLTIGLLYSPKDNKFINSWMKNHTGIAKEIIVGEDSESPSLELNKYRKSCSIFLNPLNNDFAHARNNIIQRASTNWILFLDADELLHPRSKFLLSKIDITSAIKSVDNVKVISFDRLNIFNRSFINYPNQHKCLVRTDTKYINNSPFPNASPGCHETPEGQSVFLEDFTIIHLKENWTGNFRAKGYKDENNEWATEQLLREIKETL